MRSIKISARIPLQSPPDGGASFPPGEAVGAAAPQRYRAVQGRNEHLRRTCADHVGKPPQDRYRAAQGRKDYLRSPCA